MGLARGDVVFIAFQQQDNLGVGYLASTLMEHGYRPCILDFRLSPGDLLEQVRRREPLVVGFSIIFQYHLQTFRDTMRFLRGNGIACHFTAGGHYPSLRWRDLLEFIPQLDSVVLFEGEHTLTRLVGALGEKEDWHDLPGLAVRGPEGLRANPLVPLEADLDRFPPPLRPPLREFAFGKKFATILASRGCRYDCVFCSIRRFYSAPPGPIKRIRRPEAVAEEMRLLFQEQGCSVFAFQDDDFPVGTPWGGRWALGLCRELDDNGLTGKVLWKINCRTDEIDSEVVTTLRDHGLFLVYLGIESGTDEGLRRMNKRTTCATALRSAGELKRLGIGFDFGFMLFAPWSTPDLVVADLDFLDSLCGDGSSSASFCKMLPYAETEIERRLRAEGRLRGPLGEEDYEFLEPAVERIYDLVNNAFYEWMSSTDGVLNRSRWLGYVLAMAERLASSDAAAREARKLREDGAAVMARANRFFISMVREAVVLSRSPVDPMARSQIHDRVKDQHDRFASEIGRVLSAAEMAFGSCGDGLSAR
jgi:radical SAM superfamily enzyme YgiQ (UPF0313 family)